ncbi:hypothetical protein GQ600_18542 [Phytophthora cactorum]|nr:hypothetical protein GQ600_18542 [Phytophthora cactorum]
MKRGSRTNGSTKREMLMWIDAFAYETLYGQPALFVTLTPNVATSSAMAHYTGASKIKRCSIGH